jgi:hypothetical protein
LLQVVLAPGAGVALDSGRVIVEGPTARTARIAPGTSIAIDGLRPGRYTVSLEGFADGVVEVAGEAREVQVLTGYITMANLTLLPFQPNTYAVPSPGGLEVSVDSLQGAWSYRVEWDDDSTFASPTVSTTTARTVEPAVAATGTYYVRVKAGDDQCDWGFRLHHHQG